MAWADGSIDDKERSAVLSRAAELGLTKQDVSYQLLEGWLAEQPMPELLASWKDYIGALSITLSHEAKEALKLKLLGRAAAIAEATGGRLGIADPSIRIGFGYMCSRMTNIGPHGDPRWATLIDAIKRCL